jgi:hypothetical protein
VPVAQQLGGCILHGLDIKLRHPEQVNKK